MKKILYKILIFIFSIIYFLCIITLFIAFLLVLKGICTNTPIYVFQGFIIAFIIPFIFVFSLGVVRHCEEYLDSIKIERIHFYDS